MKRVITFLAFSLIIVSCGSDFTFKEQISQYNKLVSSADSLIRIKDYKNVILKTTQAIEITDTLPKAYLIRGEANLALNKLEDAGDDFTDAINIEGDKSIAYKGRAIVNLLDDDKSDFLEDIRIYIKNHNKDSYAFSLRANYYAEDEDYENAILDYSSCLKYEPENSSFYLKRGSIYAVNGQEELSIRDYEKYTLLNPSKNNDQIFYKRGVLNMKAQNFQKAINDFGLISKSFEKKELFNLKGDCFNKLKQYNKAIENYSLYLTKIPNNHEVLEKRANSYLKINSLKNANLDFKKSASLKWEAKGFFYKYGWYILFIIGYFIVGIFSFKTIKEEYDNKKISKSYFYYFITGIFGGHYIYTDSDWRYLLHTVLIFLLFFLDSFHIRSFYNHPDLLVSGVSNSIYSLYIIYTIIFLLFIDVILSPYIVFSYNYNLRLSINDKTSKKIEIEMNKLEILMNKQNNKFKKLNS